jgi:hypothetical protein
MGRNRTDDWEYAVVEKYGVIGDSKENQFVFARMRIWRGAG